MLRMTKTTDYGIVLMAHLARQGQEPLHNARDLATETRLPLPMVNKILKLLAGDGLLEGHRGVKGGYRMTRAADRITVADIISALEGPMAITECNLPHDPSAGCDREGFCSVRSHTQRINQVIWKALGQVTLAELAQPPSPGFLGATPATLPAWIASTPPSTAGVIAR